MSLAHLLLGDVDGPVHDEPGGGLPAAWVCGGAVVGHVVVRARQEAGQGQVADGPLLPPVCHLPEARGEDADLVVAGLAHL